MTAPIIAARIAEGPLMYEANGTGNRNTRAIKPASGIDNTTATIAVRKMQRLMPTRFFCPSDGKRCEFSASDDVYGFSSDMQSTDVVGGTVCRLSLRESSYVRGAKGDYSARCCAARCNGVLH